MPYKNQELRLKNEPITIIFINAQGWSFVHGLAVSPYRGCLRCTNDRVGRYNQLTNLDTIHFLWV